MNTILILYEINSILSREVVSKKELKELTLYMHKNNTINYNLDAIQKSRKDDKGFLIVSNHVCIVSDYTIIRGLFDCYTIMVKGLFSKITFFSKKYENNITEKCKIIEYMRPTDNDSTTNGKEVKNAVLEKINSGENVLLFPEGKMSGKDFLHPFKKGIFHLAYDNKVPILPLVLNYKSEFYSDTECELFRINYHMKDTSGIDVKVFGFVYPEDFNTFEEFYNYVFSLMSQYYSTIKSK